MAKAKDKPNALDVYKFLWRGRDFELSHLWQRSIFLAVFLLGIATVYTVYLKDVFLEQFKESNKFVNGCAQIFVFGFVPTGITIIGIIFSKLWIMMAKGSKAWYEMYAYSISRISKIDDFWDDESIKRIYRSKIDELIFGQFESETKPDKYTLSTEGGAFSVSKINIMIGIVFLFIFAGLFLGHTIWTLYLLKDMFIKLRIPMYPCFCIVFFILIIAILLVFLICYLIERKVSSFYWDRKLKINTYY